MNLNARRTVTELVLENPGLIPAFERLGIDYCCEGGQSLEDACKAADVSQAQVEQSLATGCAPPTNGEEKGDWTSKPLSELIEHIVSRHHTYTRDVLSRLEESLVEVLAAHGERHPEIRHIQRVFRGLAEELFQHMLKEEKILFPYVAMLEESFWRQQPIAPAPFGTARNPVRMMMQ